MNNENHNKGFGKTQDQTVNQEHSKTQTASTSETFSPGAKKPLNVDSRVADMRHKVKQSLAGFEAAADELRDEYETLAQPIVDDFSQDLFDMISGRTVIEAVSDNVAYLLGSIQMVEKPSLGERSSKRLSLSRFKPETIQNSSNSMRLLGESE